MDATVVKMLNRQFIVCISNPYESKVLHLFCHVTALVQKSSAQNSMHKQSERLLEILANLL